MYCWCWSVCGGEVNGEVFEVKRVSDWIILLKIIVGQRVVCPMSVYAPQCSLSDSVKDLFYDKLKAVTAMIPASSMW